MSSNQASHSTPLSINRARGATLLWLALGAAITALAGAGWADTPGVASLLGGTLNAAVLCVSGIFTLVVAGILVTLAWINPYKAPDLPRARRIVHTHEKDGLGVEEILKVEFEYAAGTAEQAMEHRMTLFNFYLLIAGGVGSGVVALVGSNRTLAVAAAPLLWIFVALGGLMLQQLIALRRAWAGSAMEMNYVKEFFVYNSRLFESSDLQNAFLWRPQGLPATYTRWNVFHYSALLISFLNATALLGSIFLLGWTQGASVTDPASAALAVGLAVLFFLIEESLFRLQLVPINPPAAPNEVAPTPEPALATAPRAAGPHLTPTSYATPPAGNTVTSSATLYRGYILNLRLDQIRLPDGTASQREIVEHKPAVVIVAVLAASDEVLFIRQYRDAIGRSLLELPAGMIDAGETPEAAAIRELREETGYQAGTTRVLGTYYTSPGFTDERHHLVLATDLVQVSGIQDTTEVQSMERIPRAEALRRALAGELDDGKSVIGLLWSDHVLPRSL